MRRIWVWLLTLCGAGIALILAVLAGYFIHAQQMTPLAKLIPKVERKLAEMSGAPSELEADVALIETTFLQLRGKAMRPEGINWEKGGAIAARGADLLVMDRRGQLYLSDGASAFRRLNSVALPDNGLVAYEAFAQSPEGQKLIHNATRLRFNDLKWVQGSQSGFVVSYTFFDAERICYGTRLAFTEVAPSADLTKSDIGSNDWRVFFETDPCLPLNVGRAAIEGHMAGGRIAFEAPSTVYLGSGEYHLDGIHAPDVGVQDDGNSYGKVLAIDLANGDGRVLSKGHRNMQGVALDTEGRLWVTEHGVRGGDELNLISEGGNYGWPDATLGTLYSGQPIPNATFGRHDQGKLPTYSWLPSAAISSLMVVDGIDPAWDGDLLAGSLSSSAFGRSLWRIRIAEERVVFVERIRLGHRVRHLTQFGDKIAVLLDSNDVVIFSVSRRPDALAKVREIMTAAVDSALHEDVLSVITTCTECHSLAESENLVGPSLYGVVGRTIAGSGFPEYSEALAGISGRWSPENIKAYLVDPDAFAPGTSMPASGLTEGPVLEALVSILSQLNDRGKSDLTYN